MHCTNCGVHFYYLDIVLGNCIPSGQGYVHAYQSDCGARQPDTTQPTPKPAPKRGTAQQDILAGSSLMNAHQRLDDLQSRIQSMAPDQFVSVTQAPPQRPHDQAHHADVIVARIRELMAQASTTNPDPKTNVAPPVITPPATTSRTVPYTVKPTQGDLFGPTAVPLVFDFDDDADDDTMLPISTVGTAPQADLSFGHTGDKYWMHYRNHVFLGKRTKHMQGVQMAIADMFDLPVMPLFERDFKESTHPLPLAAPTHPIVVSTVLSNLADPFHLHQSATGEYVLLYNDREIMHPIKAVLAGYVVGVRTLMGSRA